MSYRSPHLRNQPPQEPKSELGKRGPETGSRPDDMDSAMSSPQSQPHPVTGVSSVTITHLGDGTFSTTTEHDGGEPEQQDFPDAMNLQAYLSETFPADDRDSAEPDMSDGPTPASPDMPMEGL